MNPYILRNTILGLDEKLASCQINCLNNHCYKIWKFNYCNYFVIVNQGIQKLENLSNSQARSSAKERCCYRYWAVSDVQVIARQTHTPGGPSPTLLIWNTWAQRRFQILLLWEVKNKGLSPNLFEISPRSALSSITGGLGTKGRGDYDALEQGTCVYSPVAMKATAWVSYAWRNIRMQGEKKIRAKSEYYSY